MRGLAGKKAIQLQNNQSERVVNVTSRCHPLLYSDYLESMKRLCICLMCIKIPFFLRILNILFFYVLYFPSKVHI